VFLAGEQPVVVFPFTDRSDEPVDQDTVTAGPLVALVGFALVVVGFQFDLPSS